jgi:hypothetical protein
MSYDTAPVRHGRRETFFDVAAFGRELCKALGGSELSPDTAADHYFHFQVGDAEISLSEGWHTNDCQRVHVRIMPTNFALPSGQWPRGLILPEASVPVAWPMDRIAADIKRRVIDASPEPFAALRRRQGQITAAATTLRLHAATLSERFGNLDIRVVEGDHHVAQIYSRGNRTYLVGRLYADGQVNIDRIDALSSEQFAAVCEILYQRKSR